MDLFKQSCREASALVILENFLDYITVRTAAEMVHYRPHGLHFVFEFGEIDMLRYPLFNLSFARLLRKIPFQNSDEIGIGAP